LLGYFFDSYEGHARHVVRKDSDIVVTGKCIKGRYLVKVSECLKEDVMTCLLRGDTKFGERDASTLFRNFIVALKECHDLAILHRDLKVTIHNPQFTYRKRFVLTLSDMIMQPENIMFEYDINMQRGQKRLAAKLVDFGMATTLDPGATVLRY